MNNEKTQKTNPEPSEKFQRFEDVANKILKSLLKRFASLKKRKKNKLDEA